MAIDLMTTEFFNCPIFPGPLKSGPLFYQGICSPPFQTYQAIAGGKERSVLVASVIRSDEAPMWEGARDLLGRAVKGAALRVRGIYNFELLAFDAQNELDTFKYNELGQVLANSALRLAPGRDLLVRYSSVYGILRKLVEEPWGKINLITSVEVLAEKPGSIYSLMARALKKSGALPLVILLNDMSRVPLYDPDSEEQRSAQKKLSVILAKGPADAQRECWIEGKPVLSTDSSLMAKQ